MRRAIMDFQDEHIKVEGQGEQVLSKMIPRALGFVIDRLAVWGGAVLITWLLSIIFKFEMFKIKESSLDSLYPFNPLQGAFSLIIFSTVFILDFFIAYGFYKSNGFTPGKFVMKIKAVKRDGKNITFKEALVRELLIKSIGNALTTGLINAISFIIGSISDERKALHDISVNTVVVKKIYSG